MSSFTQALASMLKAVRHHGNHRRHGKVGIQNPKNRQTDDECGDWCVISSVSGRPNRRTRTHVLKHHLYPPVLFHSKPVAVWWTQDSCENDSWQSREVPRCATLCHVVPKVDFQFKNYMCPTANGVTSQKHDLEMLSWWILDNLDTCPQENYVLAG